MIQLGDAVQVGSDWPPEPHMTVIPLADGRECVELGYGTLEGEDITMPSFHIVMTRAGEIYRCTPDELLPVAT